MRASRPKLTYSVASETLKRTWERPARRCTWTFANPGPSSVDSDSGAKPETLTRSPGRARAGVMWRCAQFDCVGHQPTGWVTRSPKVTEPSVTSAQLTLRRTQSMPIGYAPETSGATRKGAASTHGAAGTRILTRNVRGEVQSGVRAS